MRATDVLGRAWIAVLRVVGRHWLHAVGRGHAILDGHPAQHRTTAYLFCVERVHAPLRITGGAIVGEPVDVCFCESTYVDRQ